MTSIEIDNIKNFMSHLFIKESLDYFLCKEITIQTFSTFSINGKIIKDFFTEEEYEEYIDSHYIPWEKLKNYCFNIIKGNKTPLSLKAVFVLPAAMAVKLINDNGLTVKPTDIEGLYLNIRFENNRLSITSGSSLTYFTTDKSIDNIWDNELKNILNFAL